MKINKSNSLILTIMIAAGMILAGCAASAEPAELLDEEAARGKRVFSDHCAACHAISGETVIVGPSLAGISSRGGERIEGYTNLEYISESIMKPEAYLVEGYNNLMPAEFGLKLSGEEFDALVAYLLTLD